MIDAITKLRGLAVNTGHALDGEVHTFLDFASKHLTASPNDQLHHFVAYMQSRNQVAKVEETVAETEKVADEMVENVVDEPKPTEQTPVMEEDAHGDSIE